MSVILFSPAGAIAVPATTNPDVTLTNINEADSDPFGTARVDLEFRDNGEFFIALGGGSFVKETGEWVAEGDEDPGLSGEFEIRVIKSSGGLIPSGNIPNNTWTTIDVDRDLNFVTGGGSFIQYIGTVEIREIGNTSNTSGQRSLGITLNP